MQKQAIFDTLQTLAPDRLAAPWDHCGLQVGRLDEPVTGILVALNPSAEAIAAATQKGYNLLVTHHPLYFKLPSRLDTSREPGKTLEQALKGGVTIVSFHTSLDSSTLNAYVAKKLGWPLTNLLWPTGRTAFYKLVVFSPREKSQAVLEAMWEAGAGRLGNYDQASFRSEGEGTFRPLEGSKPFLGETGRRECVPEDRLEVILPENRVREVIAAMKGAHPYETVAYDLIRLEEGEPFGFGLWGELPPTPVRELARQVQTVLRPRSLRLVGDPDATVRRVGLCGGGGSELVQGAIGKVDLFVTGECKYHAALDAQKAGLMLLEAGHLATEQPIVEYLIDTLAERFHVPVEGYWEEEPFQPLGEL